MVSHKEDTSRQHGPRVCKAQMQQLANLQEACQWSLLVLHSSATQNAGEMCPVKGNSEVLQQIVCLFGAEDKCGGQKRLKSLKEPSKTHSSWTGGGQAGKIANQYIKRRNNALQTKMCRAVGTA